MENLHKHFFYGAGLVRPPAIVELVEQFIRTAAVLGLLFFFLPQYPERVVGLIVLGMVICEVFSACTLSVLYRRRLGRLGPVSYTHLDVYKRQGQNRGRQALPMVHVIFHHLVGNGRMGVYHSPVSYTHLRSLPGRTPGSPG